MVWRNLCRVHSVLPACILSLLVPCTALAQDAGAGPTLSLSEALQLARQHNPMFLQTANDVEGADWAVKEAYAQLLPSASVGTSFQYQGSGTPSFGIFSGSDLGLSRTPSYYYSSYSLSLGYTLSGAKLFAPSRERANRRATEALVGAASSQLTADVTEQYLAVKQAEDAVTLAEQQLKEAEENLKLAQAKVEVGSAIPLEAKQAEVERGRAQVALLQAQGKERTELLRLGQQLGAELPQGVVLVSTFKVEPVTWTADELIARALTHQPELLAARAQEEAAGVGVKAAKTQYLPNLSVSVGWSGNARQAGSVDYLLQQAKQGLAGQQQSCEQLNAISAGLKTPLPGRPADCGRFTWTPEAEQAVRDGNSAFPFSYTSQPVFAEVQLSLPLFGGLSRERQLEDAKLAAQDAREKVRAQELSLRTGVQAALEAVKTAEETVEIETKNHELAAEQLTLERERYRVGASSFLQLEQAETLKAKADQSYLDALYGYHTALAQLENTVGEPLRTPTGN